MKVCHIITRLIVGGAQENTLLTCRGLAERGHDVTLITGPDAGPEGSLLEEAREGGYRVEVLNSLRRAIRLREDLRARRELAAMIRETGADIVHTHSSKAGILGRLAARDAGTRGIVHTIHGMSFNRTQPRIVRAAYAAAERYCARFTHRIITVADAMIEQAVAARVAPRDRFITVYSGMRTEWYDPAKYDREAIRRSWGVGQDDVVAATVARLFRNKGYEQLIPAMADAAAKVPSLRFVWIGDGAQRGDYERELAARKIRDRVHLTGLVEPRRVAELLAGADLLVHASQWEGLPRAAVQAALLTLPVISFAIDGAPEVVIPDQTGVLVPLNDIPLLAAAMVELATDTGKRDHFGANGRALCRGRFDHRRMVEQIEAVYRETPGWQAEPHLARKTD